MTPEQQAALVGAGTALTGGVVSSTGQTFGGGKDLESYVAQLNAAFPGINAKINDQTGSEGSVTGSTVSYDTSKLPEGWDQALTGKNGGIEVSDPDSHWGTDRGSGDGTFKDPSKVHDVDGFGSYTGISNVLDFSHGIGDPGIFAPMVMAAVLGAAGGGLLGGFNGMSNAAAQGLVSGATGSMAGSAPGALATGAFDMGGSAGSGIPGSEGAAGTGAFDMGGSAGTGIPGSNGASSSFFDQFSPDKIMGNIQKNVTDPNWWMKQAGKQGTDYMRRKAAADALRARQTGG